MYRDEVRRVSAGRMIVDAMPQELREERWKIARDGLSELSVTPRSLKKSLSNADSLLFGTPDAGTGGGGGGGRGNPGLLGEVDFDELIITAIYRELRPDAWNGYLHTAGVRRLQDNLALGPFPPEPLKILGNKWDLPLQSSIHNLPLAVAAQAPFAGGETNYWQRILTGVAAGPRDQEILSLIVEERFDAAMGWGLPAEQARLRRERVCHFRHFFVLDGRFERLLASLGSRRDGSALQAEAFPSEALAVAWLADAHAESFPQEVAPDGPGAHGLLEKALGSGLDLALAVIAPQQFINLKVFGSVARPQQPGASSPSSRIRRPIVSSADFLRRLLPGTLPEVALERLTELIKKSPRDALAALNRIIVAPDYGLGDVIADQGPPSSPEEERQAIFEKALDPAKGSSADTGLGLELENFWLSDIGAAYPQVLCLIRDLVYGRAEPQGARVPASGSPSDPISEDARKKLIRLLLGPRSREFRQAVIFDQLRGVALTEMLAGTDPTKVLNKDDDMMRFGQAVERIAVEILQARGHTLNN
ncbi:MAG: hypothetical protein ACYCUV_06990 [Phycisphaerae bacterium]